MFALAADGKTNRKGMPNPLRLAVAARETFDTVQLPFPPVWIQRLGLVCRAPGAGGSPATDLRAGAAGGGGDGMRRRLRRRLFWSGVFLCLTLLWLTAQALRAAEAISRRRGAATV
jgi:hypothetical protein